jgi:predicted nuclease of predicted toxin-antitoxin system
MALLYADEQFPKIISILLRHKGHDILTVQEAGQANLGIPDAEVLAFAINNYRAVVTMNRYDFIKLHRLNSDHFGIIVCTNDIDRVALANRINEAIISAVDLRGKLIRIVRPSS